MQSYLLATGLGVPEKYESEIINVSVPESKALLTELVKSRGIITFCLNETSTLEGDIERADVDLRIGSFLEAYFPYPSRWEKARK